MAQNYATKFAPMAEEAFKLASLTEGVFSAKYDWTGAKTVSVFTNGTVAMGDYTPTAGFGTPTVVGNTVDTLTVSKDRGFSGVVDKLLMESTAGAIKAASWLGEQTRQIVTPDIDTYRFLALVTACPTGQIATAASTSANAYTQFLTQQTALDEAEVPLVGRMVFAAPAYINVLKLDSNYVKASDLAQGEIIFKGQVGQIDGVPVVKAPSGRLGSTINFILVHTDAVVAPMKLEDVQVFETVPNYSGSQIQGRYVHDCFLLDTKANGIRIHKAS